jgi:chitinase
LTFAPGEITKTINVPIFGDTLDEPDETFSMSLTNPSNNAVLGASNSATVTILDDDNPPVLAFRATSTRVVEGTGNNPANQATLNVDLSAPAAQAVTVNYAITDGTTDTKDYQAANGSLTFAPGETSKAINIPIVGDNVVEPNETFLVNLSGLSSNATLGAANSATVTITNDDLPILSMKDTAISVLEGNGQSPSPNQVVVTVNLSAAITQAVTVNYATSNGTATAFIPSAATSIPGDYLTNNGTLTFAPGETSKAITVSIIGDTFVEPDETFFITLTGVSTNATLGTPNNTTVTITNDDNIGNQF